MIYVLGDRGQDYRVYLESLTPDYRILERVINCESGWKPEAKNANSTASGLFQFLSSTWAKWGHGDVLDGFANIEAGVKLYNSEGLEPWKASASCWK